MECAILKHTLRFFYVETGLPFVHLKGGGLIVCTPVVYKHRYRNIQLSVLKRKEYSNIKIDDLKTFASTLYIVK